MSTAIAQRMQNPLATLSRRDGVLMRMFRKGAGKDLTPDEFDEACMYCEMYGANPIAKDIYFFVFDAKKPDKRRMVPVLSVNLYRKIADRTGAYRPDENPPRFTYDDNLKGPANPAGIVDCQVSVLKFAHGEWHPVTSRVRWDERAPIVTRIWSGSGMVDCEPRLDPKKDNWARMPETMLAKCCEVDAIRKAWPESVAGSYADGELDQAEVLELSATEVLEREAQKVVHAKTEGIIVDWCDGEPTQIVPIDKFADTVLAWAEAMQRDDDAARVTLWNDRNVAARRQFYGHSKSDALELNRTLDAIIKGD